MRRVLLSLIFFFFFNDTATTEIYTLSLHDALPILHRPVRDATGRSRVGRRRTSLPVFPVGRPRGNTGRLVRRSEEHTSELQSLAYLVCRLLLEKKKPHSRHRDPLTPVPRTLHAQYH